MKAADKRAQESTDSSTLLRSLNLHDASLLVIGCIVGVGIFRSASSIAQYVANPIWILLLWLAGGLLSVCGALCYAELAALFPTSGGDYIYITRIYGKFCGFLFGWTKLFIERTATIAVLAVVFAEYLNRVLPFPASGIRWVATTAVLALTAVNVCGVRWGKYVQNFFTVLKIAALGSLIIAGFWTALNGHAAASEWVPTPLTFGSVQSLGVALVFVLWTYGGWTEAAYVAEEVHQPTRNVPLAILAGVLLTTVLYFLVNWSYLIFFPTEMIAKTPQVAASVMESLWGRAGAAFIAWMIACSAFGALNGYVLTGARILYAIGKDHALFAHLSSVDPKTRTPALALWANAFIAVGLVWTKSFEQLVTYSTVVISVFFILSVFGVILLRHREPKRARPYRTWGYPVTPLIFCVTLIGFIVDLCIKQPAESAFGFLLLAMGLPLYWWSHAARICNIVRSRDKS